MACLGESAGRVGHGSGSGVGSAAAVARVDCVCGVVGMGRDGASMVCNAAARFGYDGACSLGLFLWDMGGSHS